MPNIMEYELLVLMTESSTPDELEALKQTIEEYFIIAKADSEGVKKLAYSISGQEYAQYYTFIVLERQLGNVAKLSSKLNVDDTVLRYLLIKTREKRRK